MLIGLQLVAYFSINPFLISLTDWRNTVTEEADALMHASVVKVPPGVSEQLGTPGPLGARASRLQSRPIHCV